MVRSSYEADLERLAMLREPTRNRLYQFVERQARPVSRDEAAAAIGITRELAAFHLDRLVGVGLLRAGYRRLGGRTGPGAGRTSKLYRRSRHQVQVSLPHRDHELLARVLAQTYGAEATALVEVPPAREAGRSLGARARRRIRGRPTSSRLLQCTRDVLNSLGFDPYRAGSGEIRVRNCPFAPLSRTFTPLVCGVGMSFAGGIADAVGSDQLRVSREEQRDGCCIVVTATDARSPQTERAAAART